MPKKKADSKKDNRVKTAMFLDPKQITALKELQQRTGAPMSESIRRAIDAYLEKQ